MALNKIFSTYCERCIWVIALVFLIIFDPHKIQFFSICPLHYFGFTYCPGCGLGRAISFFVHGYFTESFRTHILGIPATFVLFHRILFQQKTMKPLKTFQRSTH